MAPSPEGTRGVEGSGGGAPAPLSLRLLRSITRLVPPLPYASGVGNRIAKPLWCARHKERYVLPVWDGVLMLLDPADTVGGNLTFVPHLYERWERAAVRRLVKAGDVFVDLGANIGAYSLWAATLVGPQGTVVAIEPEPNNFATLRLNRDLNHLENVRLCNVGTSDRVEELTMYVNAWNSGGHSFVSKADGGGGAVRIPCKPLADVLREAGLGRVDFLKVDIEGFEEKVLTRFFIDAPPTSPLRPRHLLTELNFGLGGEGAERAARAICDAGFELVTMKGGDALFRRRD